jgi:integrase
LVKQKKAEVAKGELTDDQLRRVARSWLEGHRWIPETIRTAAPGDLEWQRETLPDYWIEQDAVTGDDHERWPTSVHKRAFLLQLIERQGYQTSAADADRLQPILAGMIGDMIDRRLEDLTGSNSPRQEAAKPRLKPDSRKPLSGLLDQFLDIHREAIGESTRISYRAEVERFESVVGAKAIGDIERADIVSYMDALAKMPGRHGKTMSRATIGRALSHLRMMFGWAVMRDLAAENVVQGVTTPKGKRGARAGHRRAFTNDELKAIFRHPIFTGCRSQLFIQKPGRHLLADGRFWMPLVALLSGGRLGELKALRCADYTKDRGVHFLDISIKPERDDDEEDKLRSVKTPNAIRRIPILQALIDLGFLDYLRDRQEAGEKFVFMQMSYGQLMNERLLKAVGAKSELTSFHSFRHCFKGMIRALESDETKNRLMGHAPANVGEGYDQTLTIHEAKLFLARCRPPIKLDFVPYTRRDKAAALKLDRHMKRRPVRGLRKKRS